MKKYIGLALLIVALAFVAQWGYTGTVSPPAPIWADFPAVSDVDMDSNSVTNADTVGVNTSFVYPDGTIQNTSYRTQSSLPLTEIVAGDTASMVVRTPSTKPTSLIRLGIQDSNGASVTGLSAEVLDDGTVVETTESQSTSATSSIAGGSDMKFRMNNDSGGTVTATAFVEYRYE